MHELTNLTGQMPDLTSWLLAESRPDSGRSCWLEGAMCGKLECITADDV